MTNSNTITFNDCVRLHAKMEIAARIADVTGDEKAFEEASDLNLAAIDWLHEHGSDDDKLRLRRFLEVNYGVDA